jgi:hypothetical protein
LEGEAYQWGNHNVEGRISIAVAYGSFYNARKMLSKVMQIPESELEQLHRTTVDQLMAPGAPTAVGYMKNILARRPLEPDAA